MSETIKRTRTGVKLISDDTYTIAGHTVLKLTDTRNGYIAKFPAYHSTDQDNYVCLDYSEARLLWKALGALYKEKL